MTQEERVISPRRLARPLSLCAVLLLLWTSHSIADQACRVVSGIVRASGSDERSLNGTAQLMIAGVAHSATISATVVDPPRTGSDGIVRARLETMILLDDGAALHADGPVIITSQSGSSHGRWTAVVTAAAGPMQGATGDLVLDGDIAFDPPSLSMTAAGQICGGGTQ